MSDWKPCWKRPVMVHFREQTDKDPTVMTREGLTVTRPDDLIMRGVQGEAYPIGREIFEQTYSLEPPAARPSREEVKGLLAKIEYFRTCAAIMPSSTPPAIGPPGALYWRHDHEGKECACEMCKTMGILLDAVCGPEPEAPR